MVAGEERDEAVAEPAMGWRGGVLRVKVLVKDTDGQKSVDGQGGKRSVGRGVYQEGATAQAGGGGARCGLCTAFQGEEWLMGAQVGRCGHRVAMGRCMLRG